MNFFQDELGVALALEKRSIRQWAFAIMRETKMIGQVGLRVIRDMLEVFNF